MYFKTPARQAQAELTVKRSRFIGHIAPVSDRERAFAFIEGVRLQHRDARHNVYAFRLREGPYEKYSDDGEPQGTAGLPVLEVLAKEEISDCAVAVTRYFGGVLLGTGGLSRAYADAAKAALAAAGLIIMKACAVYIIRSDYACFERIAALARESGWPVIGAHYADEVEARVSVWLDETQAFENAVRSLSAGRAGCVCEGESFAPEK